MYVCMYVCGWLVGYIIKKHLVLLPKMFYNKINSKSFLFKIGLVGTDAMQKKSVKTDHPENVQNVVLNQVKYSCIWHIFDIFSAPGRWFEAITFAWVRLLGIQV